MSCQVYLQQALWFLTKKKHGNEIYLVTGHRRKERSGRSMSVLQGWRTNHNCEAQPSLWWKDWGINLETELKSLQSSQLQFCVRELLQFCKEDQICTPPMGFTAKQWNTCANLTETLITRANCNWKMLLLTQGRSPAPTYFTVAVS